MEVLFKTMTETDPIIRVENVSKSYKKLLAVDDVSLEVKPGQIFGLIGPDGAGKSTLIHIISGVLGTKQGTVTVLGHDVLADPECIKASIGLLPQGLGMALAQELSVEENVNYFAAINLLSNQTRNERKKLLLGATELDRFRDRQAKDLSGGMKQKLALVCTLIHEPPLIFLDEPTTGVDPISRRDIWTIVNGMVKEKGLTVFLTTSYMDEAARCHNVIMMHDGCVIERGSPDSFPAKLDGQFTQIATDTIENQQKTLKILKGCSDVRTTYPMGKAINVITRSYGPKQIEAYAREHGATIESANAGTPGIEDVFLSKISSDSDGIDEAAFEEFFKTRKDHSTEASDVMIKTEGLTKTFGAFTAVNHLSFDVRRGEIFGFLGPNGAGKTTTIKMLCGLFPPTDGKGLIAGLDLFKQQFEIKQSIGYMSQKFSLYRDLTVSENIELYGGIYGVRREDLEHRRDLILRIADLAGQDDAITGDLPMGIKQRLALGCSIIHKPEVIFLDEPTSGVDPIARRQFWDIIYLLSRRMGVTVLVTTHYMDEAEHCDRLSLMTQGTLVALGSPDDLKKQVADKIGALLELTTSDPFAAVDALKKSFDHCFIFGAEVHLYTPEGKKDLPRIKGMLETAGIELRGTKLAEIPFEDVFVTFCEQAKNDTDK